MPESKPARFRIGLSRPQLVWVTAGFVMVVVIVVLASNNLQAIYDSQKDFVVGLLASFAGFCFAKAFSRAAVDKAIELIRADTAGPVRDALELKAVDLIRAAPEGPVADTIAEKTVAQIDNGPQGPIRDALEDVIRQRLDQQGAFEHIALLERNVDAALDRISEYYHAQAQDLQFHRNAPLLRVVLDDLDSIAVNAFRLRQALHKPGGPSIELRLASKERLALVSMRRDLRESLGRRAQAYEALASTAGSPISREAWDIFAVMTADILKADRTLDTLLSPHLRFPPEDCKRSIEDYLEAARRRATEFTEAVGDGVVPKVFEIMLSDLTAAREALHRIDLPDAPADPPRVAEPAAS